MIDIDRTLRLLGVAAESDFVQAEAIDAINYLREENKRLRDELDILKGDMPARAAILKLAEQNTEIERLREENARLREALKPFAELVHHIGSMSDSDGVCVYVEDLRAAAAAIREVDG